MSSEKNSYITLELYGIVHDMIRKHEGYRQDIYVDTLGHRTVGIGHLILPTEKEWSMAVGDTVSDERIGQLFEDDLSTAFETVEALFPDIAKHPFKVKVVLVNMAFNLGYNNLSKFKKMRKAINERDYKKAASEMLDSLWADQVGRRAVELAEMMEKAHAKTAE